MEELTDPNRKPIPDDVATSVLVDSRRRCALCYGLNNDLAEKKGQIAHIDRDRANAAQANLVFLCLRHHDEYDTQNSQSRRMRPSELKRHRLALYQKLGTITSPVSENKSGAPSSLIEMVLDIDYASFDANQEAELLDIVRKGLRLGSEVRIVQKSRGSVRLYLTIPSTKTQELRDLVTSGALEKFRPVTLLEHAAKPPAEEINPASGSSGSSPASALWPSAAPRASDSGGGRATVHSRGTQRKTLRPTRERVYDLLMNARQAEWVELRLEDGRCMTGAIIFNEFKGTGRLINVEQEISFDFNVDQVIDVRM